MKNAKKAGIWMDHTSANVMEIIDNFIITTNIKSAVGTDRYSLIVGKDDTHQQMKSQQQLVDYYNELAEIILKFDEIVLFGPTDAKTELLNILKDDKKFDDKMIFLQTTDKLTNNQKNAFVSEFFSSEA